MNDALIVFGRVRTVATVDKVQYCEIHTEESVSGALHDGACSYVINNKKRRQPMKIGISFAEVALVRAKSYTSKEPVHVRYVRTINTCWLCFVQYVSANLWCDYKHCCDFRVLLQSYSQQLISML